MESQDLPRPHVRSLCRFLWWCAGAMEETLRLYPSEQAKYEGIGGAVLTTGVLAFISGFYAIYTTLATGPYGIVISIGFGLLWGLAIFNLDRYIVCSLRKPTGPEVRWRQRLRQTWLPVLPRIALAIVIGISLSRPLELRLFQSAISSQVEINRDGLARAKRASLVQSSRLDELQAEYSRMSSELRDADNRATFLADEFRKETDGTGGSLRYGYSDVARVKEAEATQARQQAGALHSQRAARLNQLQVETDAIALDIDRKVDAFRTSLSDDFLTRMAALSDLSANSSAIWWISAFVTLLLVGIEITPVMVKLLSPVGPYDVKLDALFSVDTNEAILKRDATMRIATHHYELVETAERQADDEFFGIRTTLARDDLDRTAKMRGPDMTMEQLVRQVKTEIFTLRSP